ncbi:MAG: hypothetical protein OIN85_08295 [Candidatus Methanoperedens sp.]|nr:hypothetical protein [Candidatus Methanoperedens sp.]
MVSRNKIVTTVILLLLLSVLFSGCTGEKNSAPAQESINITVDVSSPNLTQSSKEENIPEISIGSFSSIYGHRNLENKGQVLFSWENVPGNESNKLLSFLKNDLGIDWVWRPNLNHQNENPNITKDEENKTIHVFTDEKSIDITLFDESASMNSSKDGGYLWQVKEENGTHNFLENKGQISYNISRVYYAVYNLSIKNNGLTTIDFKLKDLRLHDGGRIFNATLEPYWLGGLGLSEVLQDLEKQNKIHDTTLFPGQSLTGTVVFRVNSLYNKSFLLMYNTTPITSSSFEKSIEALRTAEHFNYSTALNIPPYSNFSELHGTTGSYEPKFDDLGQTWANWVNRSIFETYQKSDVERMRKSPPDDIPTTEIVYALRVFPEKNISMFPKSTELYPEFYSSNILIIDETGEEMINTSRGIAGVAVLSNRTYTLFKSGEKTMMPRMNFSSASVVQISFDGTYGGPMATRFSYSNQNVILDDKLNIIVVSYNPEQFVS